MCFETDSQFDLFQASQTEKKETMNTRRVKKDLLQGAQLQNVLQFGGYFSYVSAIGRRCQTSAIPKT